MERKIQTRQLTSGKRRVWDFSVKRQHKGEDEEDEFIEAKHKVKKHLTDIDRKDGQDIKSKKEAKGVLSIREEISQTVSSSFKKGHSQELKGKQKVTIKSVQENFKESKVTSNELNKMLESNQNNQSCKIVPPRLSITKETNTDSSGSKTDSISLIIPDITGHDLEAQLEDFVFDSEQLVSCSESKTKSSRSCLYSVQANHVELLKADLIELEGGEHAVRLPTIKHRTSLILIALPVKTEENRDEIIEPNISDKKCVNVVDISQKKVVMTKKVVQTEECVKRLEKSITDTDTLGTNNDLNELESTLPVSLNTSRNVKNSKKTGSNTSENNQHVKNQEKTNSDTREQNQNAKNEEKTNSGTQELNQNVKNMEKTNSVTHEKNQNLKNSAKTDANFSKINQISINKIPEKTFFENIKNKDKADINKDENRKKIVQEESSEKTFPSKDKCPGVDGAIKQLKKTLPNAGDIVKNIKEIVKASEEDVSMNNGDECSSALKDVLETDFESKKCQNRGTKTLNRVEDVMSISKTADEIGSTLVQRQMKSNQSQAKFMCYPSGVKVQIDTENDSKENIKEPDKFDNEKLAGNKIVNDSNVKKENEEESLTKNSITEEACLSELVQDISSIGTQINFDDDIAMLHEIIIKDENGENIEILQKQVNVKRKRVRSRKFPCNICGKSFHNQNSMLIHRRIHTSERPYVCSICDKAFSQKSSLKNHQRIHTGDKPFRCEFCEKAFRDPSSLKCHTRIHTGDKPFVCTYCDRRFIAPAVWRDHMARHTGETRFVCHLCGKGFTTSSAFKDHVLIHAAFKPYPCDVCGKCFYNPRNRRRHMAIHSDNRKKYICDLCGKGISSSTNFIKHKQTHGEKPHVCNICDKRFRDKNCFILHCKAHKERKPHVCQYCNKPFVKMSHMKRHMLTHEEVQAQQQAKKQEDEAKKPYKCTLCGKLYKNRQCFKKHYLAHPEAQNIIYRCQLCDREFSTLPFLEEHLATHEQTNLDGGTTEYVFITAEGQDQQFICSTCNQGFDNFESFENHAQSHDNTEVIYTTTEGDGLAKTIVEQVLNGRVIQTGDHLYQMTAGQANHIHQIKQVGNTEQLEYNKDLEHAKTILEFSNIEINKYNTGCQNEQSKAIEQLKEIENGNFEDMGQIPMDHAQLINQVEPLNNMVEHTEQVVIEDGRVPEPGQSLVYVTVGSEEVV